MSAMNQPATSDLPAETAMARVLDAERRAREAVDAAQAEAGHIAEAARAAQRRLAKRMRERVARVHEAFAAAVQAELLRIDALSQALPAHDEPDADDLARLERAVAQLAARLTEGT
jgi:phage host-nuclease inhibitor protein Gam